MTDQSRILTHILLSTELHTLVPEQDTLLVLLFSTQENISTCEGEIDPVIDLAE